MLEQSWHRVTHCEVCGRELPGPALNLGLQPLCDELAPIGWNGTVDKFPIEISLCPCCLTAHQLIAVRKERLFPQCYHYRARFTADVLNGMHDLVAECERVSGGVAGKLVCDVGCNDGSLLSIFRNHGARTAGIEPTAAAMDATAARHRVLNGYFTEETAGELLDVCGRPNIITFTNVFAHIESLQQAIDALKLLVDERTVIVIENHYLGAVLNGRQFDTFYHEHPRTYSARSFAFIAERLGGQIMKISYPGRYGGNIRVYIGDFNGHRSKRPEMTGAGENGFAEKLALLQGFIIDWKEDSRQQIAHLSTNASLYGKSFPGRASILINLLKLDGDTHKVIFEKPGSMKIGHYVPGTTIAIESDNEWMEKRIRPDAMVIWGWHIGGEIAAYVRAGGYAGKLYSPLPRFREIDA